MRRQSSGKSRCFANTSIVAVIAIDIDGELAWQFRSTQSAPMHLRLEESESIQQGVDRSTQASAGYFKGCRFPSYVVHPDKAGPHGTSLITARGLQ